MSETVRFGISLSQQLLDQFDQHIKKKNYTNRSEAIRDLIREELVRSEWEADDTDCVGTISIVYNHHTGELVKKLLDLQHDYGKLIISTTHIHMDHDNCLEVIVVSGKGRELKQLRNKLKSIRGVTHVRLSSSTRGNKLS